MEIRNMTIEDYDTVYQLWLSCDGMGLNNLDDSREGIDKYLQRNPDTCFVAQEDDKIIGVIISGHDGRRGFIYHTAVATEYRKKGIATKLVTKALEALKGHGIHKVALVVFDNNKSGNAFWEKCEFTLRTDLVYRNKAMTEMERINIKKR